MKIYGFLKNTSREQPDNNIFLQHASIQAIGIYDAISTINPFKQFKRALESKLSNFKFSKTASISSHSLTDHNN